MEPGGPARSMHWRASCRGLRVSAAADAIGPLAGVVSSAAIAPAAWRPPPKSRASWAFDDGHRLRCFLEPRSHDRSALTRANFPGWL